ncbi:hypothetical protein FO519_003309 [Halicephalobus sp. NKZ332]|nr:hypothetical protein FO519_003309 [Halicephalobus sp. NKZ332]
MTVTYNLDVSHSSTRGFLALMAKWRGSLWKAVLPQLAVWLIAYLFVSLIYRFMLPYNAQTGWVKVGEMLLNPLGDDDDDLECNHVIDKNLTAGLIIVDRTDDKIPPMQKDIFWEQDQIAPLYTINSSKRFVHPLIGSAAGVNLLKDTKSVIMVPHRAITSQMSPSQRKNYTRVIEIEKPYTARIDPEAQGLVVTRKHSS